MSDSAYTDTEEAREQGRREVVAFIQRRADEWRAGVPEGASIKGHHMPLKHVYRWLGEVEDDSPYVTWPPVVRRLDNGCSVHCTLSDDLPQEYTEAEHLLELAHTLELFASSFRAQAEKA